MKNFRALVLIAAAVFSRLSIAENCDEVVTYRDRNGDGAIDYEFHQYPCIDDADWELLDDDYDERYDIKIVYGFGPLRIKVDLPIYKEKASDSGRVHER